MVRSKFNQEATLLNLLSAFFFLGFVPVGLVVGWETNDIGYTGNLIVLLLNLYLFYRIANLFHRITVDASTVQFRELLKKKSTIYAFDTLDGYVESKDIDALGRKHDLILLVQSGKVVGRFSSQFYQNYYALLEALVLENISYQHPDLVRQQIGVAALWKRIQSIFRRK